jgi:hypothetical protein
MGDIDPTKPLVRPCVIKPDRIEYGRKPSSVDKVYSDLMVMSTKAQCDQQYDPSLPSSEGFTSGINDGQLLLAAIVGLSVVIIWQHIR